MSQPGSVVETQATGEIHNTKTGLTTTPFHERGERTVTDGEYAILLPWKDGFRSQTSLLDRYNYLKYTMMRNITNYCIENNLIPEDQEAQKRELRRVSNFCCNNWRPLYPLRTSLDAPLLRINTHEYVWSTRPDDVWRVLSELLNVEDADTRTKGWMAKRHTAIKEVIRRMPPDERLALDIAVNKAKKEGYPEDLKRKFAEENHEKRLREASIMQFHEMGMLSITIYVTRHTDGAWYTSCFDNIANVLGFDNSVDLCVDADNCKGHTEELKGIVLNYVKRLTAAKATRDAALSANPDASTHTESSQNSAIADITGTPESSVKDIVQQNLTSENILAIRLGANGLPIAPTPFPPPNVSPRKITKKMLEPALHTYLGAHYYRATNGITNTVPWNAISKDLHRWIHPKYLPENSAFQLKWPKNMTKDNILAFFAHISNRQTTLGLENAFRFQLIKNPKFLPSNPDDSASYILPARYMGLPPEIAESSKVVISRNVQAVFPPISTVSTVPSIPSDYPSTPVKAKQQIRPASSANRSLDKDPTEQTQQYLPSPTPSQEGTPYKSSVPLSSPLKVALLNSTEIRTSGSSKMIQEPTMNHSSKYNSPEQPLSFPISESQQTIWRIGDPSDVNKPQLTPYTNAWSNFYQASPIGPHELPIHPCTKLEDASSYFPNVAETSTGFSSDYTILNYNCTPPFHESVGDSRISEIPSISATANISFKSEREDAKPDTANVPAVPSIHLKIESRDTSPTETVPPKRRPGRPRKNPNNSVSSIPPALSHSSTRHHNMEA